jgi:molybdopterin synthase catalytic subunit
VACDREDISIRLTSDPLEADGAYRLLSRPDAGAIVVFAGTVRDHSEGIEGVSAIRYEAYEALAVPRLEAIATRMCEGFEQIRALVLWHRIGEVPLGEASVIVGVSAGHREAAFAAARYGIDTIKEAVPIWKLELASSGAYWSESANPLGDPSEVPNRV